MLKIFVFLKTTFFNFKKLNKLNKLAACYATLRVFTDPPPPGCPPPKKKFQKKNPEKNLMKKIPKKKFKKKFQKIKKLLCLSYAENAQAVHKGLAKLLYKIKY
jgi:hypothetical protein